MRRFFRFFKDWHTGAHYHPPLWIIFLSLILAGCGVNAAERNNAANWYTAQRQYQDAVSAYQAAQVAEPDNPQLYFNAAEALARDGDLEAAIQTLQQAMERGDETLKAKALYNLGGILIEQEMYQEAVDAYRQALLIQPDYTEARHNLEVAMLYLTRPTPTALEQKIQPEQQNADTSATPTPAFADPQQPSPTPTPPPQGLPEGPTPSGGEPGEQETGEDKGTPQPNDESDLNAEEARQILDQVKQDQPGIGGMPDYEITPATPPSGKDW